jgi:hypothetical protein
MDTCAFAIKIPSQQNAHLFTSPTWSTDTRGTSLIEAAHRNSLQATPINTDSMHNTPLHLQLCQDTLASKIALTTVTQRNHLNSNSRFSQTQILCASTSQFHCDRTAHTPAARRDILASTPMLTQHHREPSHIINHYAETKTLCFKTSHYSWNALRTLLLLAGPAIIPLAYEFILFSSDYGVPILPSDSANLLAEGSHNLNTASRSCQLPAGALCHQQSGSSSPSPFFHDAACTTAQRLG